MSTYFLQSQTVRPKIHGFSINSLIINYNTKENNPTTLMKQLFKNYLEKELAKNQSILSQNTLSEEDRAVVEAAVASLQETIEAVDAAEDNNLIDELKATVETMQESLTAIKEKINQTQKEEPTTEMENYLSTMNAVHDFAQAVRNSRNGAEFLKNWSSVLSTNSALNSSITIDSGSEEYFLPEIVKSKIQDQWDRNADWLKDLMILNGVKRYTVRKNDSDQERETSRAKGWKKGDTKAAQALQFSGKLITTQFIYKLAEISTQDEWDDNTVVDYIVNELVDQILYEEKRAILVGDGRERDSDYKINSFEAIAKNTADAYTNVASVTGNGFLVDDIRALVDGIHNPNGKAIYVFMSKADLRTLSRVQASETSTPMYMGIEQVAEQIGATKIITTDLLGSDYKAIAMIPSEYVIIGANVLNPILYSWHEGYKNMDVYRYECAAGGGIQGLKSTAVLLAQ